MGWQDELTALATRRGAALIGYAYLLCGDLPRAHDLVQEALVRSWTRPARVLGPKATEGYVRRAVLNVYLDEHRRERGWTARRHLAAVPTVAPDTASRTDDHVVVQEALAGLPPQERACVVLRFYDDLTVPELARRLGISEGTAKRYLSDALGRLEREARPRHRVGRAPHRAPDGGGTMNLTDALEQIAAGAAARGGLDDAELDTVVAGVRRGRRWVTGTVLAGLAGAAAAGVLALSLLDLAGTPQPPVAPTETVGPSPTTAPSPTASSTPSGTWPSAVTVAAMPQCEDPAPVLDVPAEPLLAPTIFAVTGVLPADQALDIPMLVDTAGDAAVTVDGTITFAVVAREGPWAGKVVGVTTATVEGMPDGSPESGTSTIDAGLVVLDSCIPGLRSRASDTGTVREYLLPNGTYDLYEVVPLTAATVEGATFGGPEPLLLAAGPQTLEIGDPVPAPAAVPDLPTCGESTDGLTSTGLGQVSARTTGGRSAGGSAVHTTLVNDGPAWYEGLSFSAFTWVVARDGVVVDTGGGPTPGERSVAVVQPHEGDPAHSYGWDPNVAGTVTLDGLTDCRTGAPLDESTPIDIWTRSVVTLDLTPANGADADAEVVLVAPAAWFTYHPTLWPIQAPVLDEFATGPVGTSASMGWQQVGEQAWVVQQSWNGETTFDWI